VAPHDQRRPLGHVLDAAHLGREPRVDDWAEQLEESGDRFGISPRERIGRRRPQHRANEGSGGCSGEAHGQARCISRADRALRSRPRRSTQGMSSADLAQHRLAQQPLMDRDAPEQRRER
jgi:hypothetical protein